MTPTQRTLKRLREQGYLVAIVERWNPHARIRQDLFGFVDVLAIRPGETLAVQVTSGSNLSKRIHKISEHENVGAVRDAGWRIEAHGWRKNARGIYVQRVEDLS